MRTFAVAIVFAACIFAVREPYYRFPNGKGRLRKLKGGAM